MADQLKRPGFDIHRSRDGEFYFTLVANNNEVVATSEMYPSKSNAERGVKAACDAFAGAAESAINDRS